MMSVLSSFIGGPGAAYKYGIGWVLLFDDPAPRYLALPRGTR